MAFDTELANIEADKHLEENGTWLRRWLPSFEDKRQKRAFANIFRFMAIVLVFTIVARGTAGATLAKVELTSPAPGKITEAIYASGIAGAVRTASPDVPENVTVEQILVTPGQVVKAGDVLAILDAGELKEQYGREQIVLETLELNLARLERGEPYDASGLLSAQTAYDWAEQDAGTAKAKGQADADAAKQAMIAAQDRQAAAQASCDEVAADENASDEEKDAARQLLEAAKADAEQCVQAVADAENAAKENETAAARSLESARQGLDAAKQADAKARQTEADIKAQNVIDAKSLRLDIQRQKERLALFEVVGEEGEVVSGIDGTVLEIGMPGMPTGTAGLVKVSDAAGGFVATAMIAKKQADELAAGAQAEVSAQDGYYDMQSFGQATLLSVSEGEEGSVVTATFRLPEGVWKQGQGVSLQIVQSEAEYFNCVPVSAVRQDQGGYYVLKMEESSGVLGVENVVRTVPIKVLASDGSVAAIEGGVSGADRLVMSATKPLEDGDKVRVKQV